MTNTDAIDTIDKCIDLLAQIPADDEIHRTFVVNRVRENLWAVRDKLVEAGGKDGGDPVLPPIED